MRNEEVKAVSIPLSGKPLSLLGKARTRKKIGPKLEGKSGSEEGIFFFFNLLICCFKNKGDLNMFVD